MAGTHARLLALPTVDASEVTVRGELSAEQLGTLHASVSAAGTAPALLVSHVLDEVGRLDRGTLCAAVGAVALAGLALLATTAGGTMRQAHATRISLVQL